MIKLETAETATLKLLQEKVAEANSVVQAYASLLSKKYELPKDSQFTFNSDFTQIVEIPKPLSAPSDPSVKAQSGFAPGQTDAPVESNVVPLKRGRKRKEVEAEPVIA